MKRCVWWEREWMSSCWENLASWRSDMAAPLGLTESRLQVSSSPLSLSVVALENRILHECGVSLCHNGVIHSYCLDLLTSNKESH